MTPTELRQLLADATPGPWRNPHDKDRNEEQSNAIMNDAGERVVWATEWDSEALLAVHQKDAALICAAVNALPRLLSVVEAAEALDRYVDEKLRHGRGTTTEVALRRALAALRGAT